MATVTIAATEIVLTKYQGEGVVYLAIYANQDLITQDGHPVAHGDPNIENSFFRKYECEVDEAGVVAIPLITDMVSTEDALVNPYVTLSAFLLDAQGAKIQQFLYSFRVPYLILSTTWAALMQNLSVPQVIIDPEVERTQNYYQMFDEDAGMVDGNMWQDGSLTRILDGLDVGGSITGDSIISSSSVDAASGQFTEDVDIDQDLNVGGAGNFGGPVTAPSFTGSALGLSGYPTVIPGPSGYDSTGSITYRAARGTGIGRHDFYTDAGAGDVLREYIGNNGRHEFLFGASGKLHDSGGMRFDVKGGLNPVAGDGVTDDTAAIQARIDEIEALGGSGVLYFPHGCLCAVTDRFVLPSGITVEGAGNFKDGGCGIIQMSTNKEIFRIREDRSRIRITNIWLSADSQTGTMAIHCEPITASVATSGLTFDHLTITGFYKPFYVAGGGGSWQCDGVTVWKVVATENKFFAHLNTQNADYWRFVDCQAAAHHAFHFERCGFVTLDQSVGINTSNPGGLAEMSSYTAGSTFLTYGPANSGIYVKQCQQENYSYGILTADTDVGNFSADTVIESDFLGPCVFRFNHMVSVIGGVHGAGGMKSTRPDVIFLGFGCAPDNIFDVTDGGTVRMFVGKGVNQAWSGFSVIGPDTGASFGVGTNMPGDGITDFHTGIDIAAAGNLAATLRMRRTGSSGVWDDRDWRLLLASDGGLILEDKTSGEHFMRFNVDGTIESKPISQTL